MPPPGRALQTRTCVRCERRKREFLGLGIRHSSSDQWKRNVVEDREVWKQRIVLKNDTEFTLVNRHVVHELAVWPSPNVDVFISVLL